MKKIEVYTKEYNGYYHFRKALKLTGRWKTVRESDGETTLFLEVKSGWFSKRWISEEWVYIHEYEEFINRC